MSAADVRRGAKQRSKAAPADRERKERHDTQQPPSTIQSSTAAAPSSSSSSPSVEELRASLSSIPSQSGYLIADHQATVLAVSSRTTPHQLQCAAPTSTNHLSPRACCCCCCCVPSPVVRSSLVIVHLRASLPSSAARRTWLARSHTRSRQRAATDCDHRLRHVPLYSHYNTSVHHSRTHHTTSNNAQYPQLTRSRYG